ncbi:hypothetical protein TNCV_4631061 [Trichonephila clavipes]|nr:hypothetical protein TNCV_4631061 [Trichonephila clavipes]
MVELVKGISKLPDRRLEADRPRHSIQFINDHQVQGRNAICDGRGTLSIGRAARLPLVGRVARKKRGVVREKNILARMKPISMNCYVKSAGVSLGREPSGLMPRALASKGTASNSLYVHLQYPPHPIKHSFPLQVQCLQPYQLKHIPLLWKRPPPHPIV